MTFDEWFKQYCKEEGITQSTGVDKVDMLACWEASREDLLKEMYPLRVVEHNTYSSKE